MRSPRHRCRLRRRHLRSLRCVLALFLDTRPAVVHVVVAARITCIGTAAWAFRVTVGTTLSHTLVAAALRVNVIGLAGGAHVGVCPSAANVAKLARSVRRRRCGCGAMPADRAVAMTGGGLGAVWEESLSRIYAAFCCILLRCGHAEAIAYTGLAWLAPGRRVPVTLVVARWHAVLRSIWMVFPHTRLVCRAVGQWMVFGTIVVAWWRAVFPIHACLACCAPGRVVVAVTYVAALWHAILAINANLVWCAEGRVVVRAFVVAGWHAEVTQHAGIA